VLTAPKTNRLPDEAVEAGALAPKPTLGAGGSEALCAGGSFSSMSTRSTSPGSTPLFVAEDGSSSGIPVAAACAVPLADWVLSGSVDATVLMPSDVIDAGAVEVAGVEVAAAGWGAAAGADTGGAATVAGTGEAAAGAGNVMVGSDKVGVEAAAYVGATP
jgi:hypothetical protein